MFGRLKKIWKRIEPDCSGLSQKNGLTKKRLYAIVRVFARCARDVAAKLHYLISDQ